MFKGRRVHFKSGCLLCWEMLQKDGGVWSREGEVWADEFNKHWVWTNFILYLQHITWISKGSPGAGKGREMDTHSRLMGHFQMEVMLAPSNLGLSQTRAWEHTPCGTQQGKHFYKIILSHPPTAWSWLCVSQKRLWAGVKALEFACLPLLLLTGRVGSAPEHLLVKSPLSTSSGSINIRPRPSGTLENQLLGTMALKLSGGQEASWYLILPGTCPHVLILPLA